MTDKKCKNFNVINYKQFNCGEMYVDKDNPDGYMHLCLKCKMDYIVPALTGLRKKERDDEKLSLHFRT